ncbi:hypothetical protein VDBG_08988 [Verticillium alfalfae VaMs.102]|uniref:Uncharacterized protein n=2 Tax=Verticillium TaxID=1036719 RepID=G2X513_VERDV|nr:hypothetical protein VDBG_08988 [Verticillium alfalfae VaMs.102]XP_009653276.1 uncharacterized protein VDAG_05245 [Verticillium dahliae VdLs.17]EEY22878.1 hypothetical protein VDBG_08988 [Verticillium alfalfae VaMs.102]EGY23807.1 hypothetical protein VDAG_05245 [Verticillium dahliae VdLs.17]
MASSGGYLMRQDGKLLMGGADIPSKFDCNSEALGEMALGLCRGGSGADLETSALNVYIVLDG